MPYILIVCGDTSSYGKSWVTIHHRKVELTILHMGKSGVTTLHMANIGVTIFHMGKNGVTVFHMVHLM